MSCLTIKLADDAATEALGARLAAETTSRPGGVIYLQGTLGAGKTTLARGFLRSLGVSGSIRSPTYTLIEPYRIGDQDLLHMDLYRLKHPDELEGLGLDDYAPSRCWWLVEWPECGTGFLPPASLVVRLSADGEGRLAELETTAEWPLIAARWPEIVPNLR
ncbi:tRNA (adenosine(37)-N6)-threonylcarbamoyltransferase complex ATPase subunit type 1 TsaE [Nevskia ramosa]|uniref:tRNA (adenosine(37)-N6)-threonylcarbamoyltransferase complex ATPase subunit type 1 TsaE n=1 Tax=Nevskia ramosa TaxID=64002 RepID=UPI0003B76E07|nr:tRNA (adenosine(37)-N6)-threonylcarbamoyltransferase complex ATPase subunit type 1 TsaE [Nevskia ramosa]